METQKEGATNTQVRLVCEFFTNFRPKWGVRLILGCDL